MKFLPILIVLFLSGCASMKPIRTAEAVDLDRFMGDWYVMANIPTFLERDAWNALEHYELREDGVILTTFTFNKGGPEGPLKEYHPKGFVRDTESNAVWGMQFIWPFRAEFIIVHVDEDYSETIIGRRKRDYVWIMARDVNLPGEDLDRLIQIAVDEGYDRDKIQRVPHSNRKSE
ncbi:MAG: lipocalin family protein [Verrucomicrobia bacterium]|nr:lipocalin family protein [Verrucomicrobiota bacterium]MCH8525636.1 lipocalin family protein [Kiritimatiellia bacterium]